jgi:hypothetical protein
VPTIFSTNPGSTFPDANVAQWQFVPSSGWSAGEIDASGAALPVPSGSAPGVPLALTQANGLINIFAVNRNADVGQVQFSFPAGWGAGVVAAGGVHLAVGTPLGLYEGSNGVTTIFGVNTSGNIAEVEFVPGSGWGGAIITATNEAFATGSGVAGQTKHARLTGRGVVLVVHVIKTDIDAILRRSNGNQA